MLKLLKALTSGDVVMVTRIDRLARSTFDLFAIVKQIVEAGGQCRSLAGPWADTATSTGRLMIAVLGGLADVERDLIRTRTAEGRSRVKAARAWWAASVFGRRSISNGRPYRLYRATGLVRVLVRARRCICSVVRLNVHQNTGRLALSPRRAAWYSKPAVTFADVIARLRQHLWFERIVTSTAGIDMTEPIRPVIQRIIEVACHAPLRPLTPKSDQQDWAMSKLLVGRISIAL